MGLEDVCFPQELFYCFFYFHKLGIKIKFDQWVNITNTSGRPCCVSDYRLRVVLVLDHHLSDPPITAGDSLVYLTSHPPGLEIPVLGLEHDQVLPIQVGGVVFNLGPCHGSYGLRQV